MAIEIHADMAELAATNPNARCARCSKVFVGAAVDKNRGSGRSPRRFVRAPQESRGARMPYHFKWQGIPSKHETTKYADMAELADALDSGSSESNFMQVRPLLSAPKNRQVLNLSVFPLYFKTLHYIVFFGINPTIATVQ